MARRCDAAEETEPVADRADEKEVSKLLPHLNGINSLMARMLYAL